MIHKARTVSRVLNPINTIFSFVLQVNGFLNYPKTYVCDGFDYLTRNWLEWFVCCNFFPLVMPWFCYKKKHPLKSMNDSGLVASCTINILTTSRSFWRKRKTNERNFLLSLIFTRCLNVHFTVKRENILGNSFGIKENPYYSSVAIASNILMSIYLD